MHRIIALFFATLLTAAAENPFGLFDFNLRGKTPAEQIHSLDGIGYEGITLPLKTPKNLEMLEAYQAAKPDLKQNVWRRRARTIFLCLTCAEVWRHGRALTTSAAALSGPPSRASPQSAQPSQGRLGFFRHRARPRPGHPRSRQ